MNIGFEPFLKELIWSVLVLNSNVYEVKRLGGGGLGNLRKISGWGIRKSVVFKQSLRGVWGKSAYRGSLVNVVISLECI